ncbi:hypothetical protein ACYSNW_07950 [Enterococcus sp. LJL99]
MTDLWRYQVDIEQKFTHFLLTKIETEKINVPEMKMTSDIARVEDYFDVEYPVRTLFLQENDLSVVPFKEEGYTEIYTPFERDRVDLTTFISTPHKLSAYAKTLIEVPASGIYNFRIRTCGAVKLWVNGHFEDIFAPYTRNHYSEKSITLPFEQGVNELVIYLEDLAERDVSFYFELINENEFPLNGFVTLPTPIDEFKEAEQMLSDTYLEKDIVKEGAILLNFGSAKRARDFELRVRVNPRLSLVEDGSQDGNITDFEIDDLLFKLEKNQAQLSLGDVSAIPTAGFTRLELGIQLSSGVWITRTLTCSIYDENKFSAIITGQTIQERKKEALDYFSTLELEDINVALVRAYLDQLQETDVYQDYESAFLLIEEKGDCADFILAPLLAVYSLYKERFPKTFHPKMESLTTQFRYWIDEPGNDVMWYFSENHALLFHVSQYLGGYLYPEAEFTVSGRTGNEQYLLGKQRVEAWFEYFFRVGFSEWNSTTYFPIDLIGFFSLYMAAPDQSVKELAKKALDYTFELIALNYHGGTMASTFGRVYEHNLKAMQLGEISSVIEIIWKKGYFNNSLRASALLALTDYEPPTQFEQLLCDQPHIAVHAEYQQGDNQAYTYLYKTVDYSLASAINYQPKKRGHQQHIINLSLGEGTLLWLNNPGEAEYSGGNRPSFWAGNDCLPYVSQYKNVLFAHYQLQETDYRFIHLYLPYWDLDELIEKENWWFIRKKNTYVAIFFTNPTKQMKGGAIHKREIRVSGDDQYVLVKLSSKLESHSFEAFMDMMLEQSIQFKEDRLIYEDPQYGLFEYTNELSLNNKSVLYEQGYQLFYEIESI